jgi:hypothetical protein
MGFSPTLVALFQNYECSVRQRAHLSAPKILGEPVVPEGYWNTVDHPFFTFSDTDKVEFLSCENFIKAHFNVTNLLRSLLHISSDSIGKVITNKKSRRTPAQRLAVFPT